jgi:FkbM family methyltransferase
MPLTANYARKLIPPIRPYASDREQAASATADRWSESRPSPEPWHHPQAQPNLCAEYHGYAVSRRITSPSNLMSAARYRGSDAEASRSCLSVLVGMANSLRPIVANRHFNRAQAFRLYCLWQYTRSRRAFPFTQVISRSLIVAHDARCGVSALIASQGLYDYANMRLFAHIASDGGLFLDIGANIGPYALVVSESPSAQALAFEPHPMTFARLQENLRLNGRHNVTARCQALGAEDGVVRFTDEPGAATNRAHSDGAITVEVVRADSVCRQADLIPRYVKIDVEGHEYEVLKGFDDLLGDVMVVAVEANGLGDDSAASRPLWDAGFAGPYWCDFDARRLMSRRPASANPVFLRPQCDLRGLVVHPAASFVHASGTLPA